MKTIFYRFSKTLVLISLMFGAGLYSLSAQCPGSGNEYDLVFTEPIAQEGGYSVGVELHNCPSNIVNVAVIVDVTLNGATINCDEMELVFDPTGKFGGSLDCDVLGSATRILMDRNSGTSTLNVTAGEDYRLFSIYITGDPGELMDMEFDESSSNIVVTDGGGFAFCDPGTYDTIDNFEIEDVSVSGSVTRLGGTCNSPGNGGINAEIRNYEEYYRDGADVDDNLNSNTSGGAYTALLVPNGDYVVKPEKDDAPKCGLRTLGIVLIRRHLQDKQHFTNYWQLLAADTNGDGKVSTIDLIHIRRLLLDKATSMPAGSWVFVTSEFYDALPTFNASTAPSNLWPYDDHYDYNNISSAQTLQDFYGVKVGLVESGTNQCSDCDGTSNDVFVSASADFLVSAGIHTGVEEKDIVDIDIVAESSKYLEYFNCQFDFDATCLKVIDVLPGDFSDEEDFMFYGDTIGNEAFINFISLEDPGSLVNIGDTLGILRCEITGSCTTTENEVGITGSRNVAADTTDTTPVFYDIVWDNSRPEPNDFNNSFNDDAFKVYPVPTTGKIIIDLQEPIESPMEVEVFSSSGQLMRGFTLGMGLSRTELDVSSFPKGVYSLRYSQQGTPKSIKFVIQ